MQFGFSWSHSCRRLRSFCFTSTRCLLCDVGDIWNSPTHDSLGSQVVGCKLTLFSRLNQQEVTLVVTLTLKVAFLLEIWTIFYFNWATMHIVSRYKDIIDIHLKLYESNEAPRPQTFLFSWATRATICWSNTTKPNQTGFYSPEMSNSHRAEPNYCKLCCEKLWVGVIQSSYKKDPSRAGLSPVCR